MKLQNLSYKTLFTIFFFAVAGIVFLIKIGGNVGNIKATWWDASWLYRRSIGVTNSSGVGQTNVLVKVLENYDLSSLVSASKLQADLDDIRLVTSDDGTTISYYITDSTNASVDLWAIIPSFPTSGISIWMYYGNSSATAVSAVFYTYSGTKTFTDDGSGKLRIKFLTSGTLATTANMRANEVFLVGGGGGGGACIGGACADGGGGGGGRTNTQTGIGVTLSTNYSIVIGIGGSAGTAGGTSQGFGSTAPGGSIMNGGSGGGRSGYTDNGGAGGSNGGNGSGTERGGGGTGQATTTREFGDVAGTLYAGGGGGGTGYGGAGTTGGTGGTGGGGNGQGPGASTAGTPNTGGGGGSGSRGTTSGSSSGGSGIVVLRYTSPSSTNFSSEELLSVNPPSNCLIDQGSDNTTFTLRWIDNSSNEDGFKIYKNGSLLTTLGAGVTSYVDSPITPGTSYAYKTFAYLGGYTSPSCDFSILQPDRNSFKMEGIKIN